MTRSTAILAWFLLPAVLHAQDMALNQVLIPDENWEQVASGYKFTEGPAVDAQGHVYFTDIPNNKIHKLDVATLKVNVFVEQSYATNGLMFGPDGLLYGCQNGQKKIVAYDAQGQAKTIAADVASNDLVVDRRGNIYFTDPANQRVWFIPAGEQPRVVDEGIERPNGIILWPDQHSLVVADSAGDRLWVFRIEKDGSLRFKSPYYFLRTPNGQTRSSADGMTVDSVGRLYCTTNMGLQMFDPTGRMGGVILKPQQGPLSNVVFAGPKLDTLYVTAGDKIFRRLTKTTGLRYSASK